MPRTVGVAPGTITLQLGEPGKQLVIENPYVAGRIALGVNPSQAQAVTLGGIDTRARIRWDLIGIVGGGSLIVALAAGLIASAID